MRKIIIIRNSNTLQKPVLERVSGNFLPLILYYTSRLNGIGLDIKPELIKNIFHTNKSYFENIP